MDEDQSKVTDEDVTMCSELFVTLTGEPMQFSIKLCYERPELERLITSCGGRMVSDRSGPHTIRLFPSGERGYGKVGDFFTGQYIYDCIKERKLLPLINYRLNEKSRYDPSINPMDILLGKFSWDECKIIDGRTEFEVSDFSDDEDGKEPHKTKKSKSRGLPYTRGERKAMLNYIISKKRYGEVKGRALWEDMAKAKVCPGRTWQSMKQQYRTHIIDNLATFKLPDSVARRIYTPYFKKGNNQLGSSSEEEPEVRETGLGSNMEHSAGEKGQFVKDMNDLNIVNEDKQQENGGETHRAKETGQGSTIEHCTNDDQGQHEKDENERNVLKENEEKESTSKVYTSETGQVSSPEQCAETANDKRQVENEQKTVNEDEQKENGGGETITQETSLGSSEELCATVTDGKGQDEGEENGCKSLEKHGKSADDKDEKDENELESIYENEECVWKFVKENILEDETLGIECETRQTRKRKEQVVNENALTENKERRKEYSEVVDKNQVGPELNIDVQGDLQDNYWIEQESEGANSQQCNKQNIEEDLEKQESEHGLEKRGENDMEDCQASQNNIVEKFENDMKQRKESQKSEADRETCVYETQEFDCVLSTEGFECNDIIRKKPNNILVELENDWHSGSSAGDAVLSGDRSHNAEFSDKNHAENEFSKEIRETSSQNQSCAASRSQVMLQDDVYTSGELLLCRPQESAEVVNEINERIDEDSYQKSAQKESEYQATLSSSKVTVEDINEMQEIIDGTFDIGSVDKVSLNICGNLPDAGSGIIENMKSQDSEALLEHSQVRKNHLTSFDEVSPNSTYIKEVHDKIDGHNLISSFLQDIESNSNGSTVVFTLDHCLGSSDEIEDSDSGSGSMLRERKIDSKNHSSDLDTTAKRKALFCAPRVLKKTRIRHHRNSKRASQKTASKKADNIQPDRETESHTQHGNFTAVKDGRTSKGFVFVTSSGDESSPESDTVIQRSIPTINRRRLNQRMMAVSSPEIPLSVSQDVGLSNQEQLGFRSDSDISESEESVEECQNLVRENMYEDYISQVTTSDPASSRDSFTGRYDRSFNPRSGCTVGASRKTVSGHINPSFKKESYSLYEDIEIIKYIIRHEAYDRVKGRELWQEMEKCEILSKRSWHSLKERYRKRIIARLHTYLPFGLSQRAMRLIQSHAPSQVEEPSPRAKGNENSRRPYTHKEDELIVKFITKNRRYSEVGGKTLWVVMTSAVPGLKNRTWLSLKERFRKNIVKRLKDFNLTNDEVENFKRQSRKPARNGKSIRRVSFRKPPERYERRHSKPFKSLQHERDQKTETSTDDEVETSDSERERIREIYTDRKRVLFNKGERKLVAHGKSQRVDEKMHENRKVSKESKRYPKVILDADDIEVQPSTSGYIPKKKGTFDDQKKIDDQTKRAEESQPTVLPKAIFKRKLFNQDEMAKLTPQTPFDRDECGGMKSQWKATKRKQNSFGINDKEQRRKKSKEETSCESNQEENGSSSQDKNETCHVIGLEITKEGENSQAKCGKSKDYKNLHIKNGMHEANSGGHEDQSESVFRRIIRNVESEVDSQESRKTVNDGPSCRRKKILNADDKSITQPDVTPEPDAQERPLSPLTNVKGKSLRTVILDGCTSSSNNEIDVANVLKKKQKCETEPDRNNKTDKNVKGKVCRRHISSQSEVSPVQIKKCSVKLTRFTARNKLRKKVVRKKN